MPKGYVRDSGMLNHLLRIREVDDLYTHPMFGQLFESYVIESIITGIQCTTHTQVRPYYYRTRDRAEIDLILEGSFGTIPIEIKSGSSVKKGQLKSLSAFVRDNNLTKGIVVNQADRIELVTPEILQVPVGYL